MVKLMLAASVVCSSPSTAVYALCFLALYVIRKIIFILNVGHTNPNL